MSHGFGREKIGGLKIQKEGVVLQNWLCDGPYLEERKLAFNTRLMGEKIIKKLVIWY